MDTALSKFPTFMIHPFGTDNGGGGGRKQTQQRISSRNGQSRVETEIVVVVVAGWGCNQAKSFQVPGWNIRES